MLGGVLEKLPNESEAFVVGDVGGGLVLEGPAVEEVGEVGFDDRRGDCRGHGEGVEGHDICLLLVTLRSDKTCQPSCSGKRVPMNRAASGMSGCCCSSANPLGSRCTAYHTRGRVPAWCCQGRYWT